MEKINKAILVNKIVKKTGVTKKQASEALEVILSTAKDALAEGNKAQLLLKVVKLLKD
jgi:nucleoid DNA-binding protein